MAEAELQDPERPLRGDDRKHQVSRHRLAQRFGGELAAVLLASLLGGDQRHPREQVGGAGGHPGLACQVEPLGRGGDGGGETVGGRFADRQELERVGHEAEGPPSARGLGRACVQAAGEGVVTDVESGGACGDQVQRLVERLSDAERFASNRDASGGIALEDQADPGQQPVSEHIQRLQRLRSCSLCARAGPSTPSGRHTSRPPRRSAAIAAPCRGSGSRSAASDSSS